MARQLARAAGGDRHKLPSQECLLVYIRRWERGNVGVSERYMLLYCAAFGIEPGQFGPAGWVPTGMVDAGDGIPDTTGAAGLHARGHPGADDGQPGPAGPARAAVGGAGLAAIFRDVRDSLRADAELHHKRAEKMNASTISAAVLRGQALAYAVAAEHIDAVLASSAAARCELEPLPLPPSTPAADNGAAPRRAISP